MTGGGYYSGVVTNQAGGTLTPGTGNSFGAGLVLAGGSTNVFEIDSVTAHDMSVVSNGLTQTGNGNPLLVLNLQNYNQSANPTNGVIMLYQNYGSSVFDGINEFFMLSDSGPNNGERLKNGTAFEAVGGSGTTNEFKIWYDFDITGDSHTGNSIALTVIPEPGTILSLLGAGSLFALVRRIRRITGRWRI